MSDHNYLLLITLELAENWQDDSDRHWTFHRGKLHWFQLIDEAPGTPLSASFRQAFLWSTDTRNVSKFYLKVKDSISSASYTIYYVALPLMCGILCHKIHTLVWHATTLQEILANIISFAASSSFQWPSHCSYDKQMFSLLEYNKQGTCCGEGQW